MDDFGITNGQADTANQNGITAASEAAITSEAAFALIRSGQFAPRIEGGEYASDAFAKRKSVEKELEERRWAS